MTEESVEGKMHLYLGLQAVGDMERFLLTQQRHSRIAVLNKKLFQMYTRFNRYGTYLREN
jgi:hypothetical protein